MREKEIRSHTNFCAAKKSCRLYLKATLNAILFLYKEVPEIELGWINDTRFVTHLDIHFLTNS